MPAVAQKYHTNQVHYLRAEAAYTDGTGKVYTLGVIPANSIVIRGGVAVITAFNAGTSNTLNIGTSTDDDGFATLLALGTVGVIVADEMATSNDFYLTTDQTVTATLTMSGTAATTGQAVIWLEYIPRNYD